MKKPSKKTLKNLSHGYDALLAQILILLLLFIESTSIFYSSEELIVVHADLIFDQASYFYFFQWIGGLHVWFFHKTHGYILNLIFPKQEELAFILMLLLVAVNHVNPNLLCSWFHIKIANHL